MPGGAGVVGLESEHSANCNKKQTTPGRQQLRNQLICECFPKIRRQTDMIKKDFRPFWSRVGLGSYS